MSIAWSKETRHDAAHLPNMQWHWQVHALWGARLVRWPQEPTRRGPGRHAAELALRIMLRSRTLSWMRR